MMADYAGIKVPAVLVLNLMDVAKQKGLTIDTETLSKKLGIPVIPFVAADKKGYGELKSKLAKALNDKKSLNAEGFESQFKSKDFGYDTVREITAQAETAQVSSFWYAAKAMEKDENVMNILSSKLSKENMSRLKSTVNNIDKVALTSGICKFDAVHELTEAVLKKKKEAEELSRFDKIATGRISGKLVALLMVILAFAVAMIIAAPIMGVAGLVPGTFSEPVGQAIEPITHLFGLKWQAFMAFLSSMLAKESMLGVMGALFGGSSDMVTIAFNAKNGVDTSIMNILPEFFTKAEMLAFLLAVSFNMPCVMAMSTTYKENHSKKWTAIIAGYYTAFSLVLAFIAYHIGLIIF